MNPTLTGAAGEHYVAYKLSLLGYSVGLSRGGSPTVDIMIANSAGEGVFLQVKTSNGARRTFKRNIVNNRWEFSVGAHARSLNGERLLYAFVDLNWRHGTPNVFIVPSKDVKNVFEGTSYRWNFFWLTDAMKEKYFERWDYIEALVKKAPNQELETTPTADASAAQQPLVSAAGGAHL